MLKVFILKTQQRKAMKLNLQRTLWNISIVPRSYGSIAATCNYSLLLVSSFTSICKPWGAVCENWLVSSSRGFFSAEFELAGKAGIPICDTGGLAVSSVLAGSWVSDSGVFAFGFLWSVDVGAAIVSLLLETLPRVNSAAPRQMRRMAIMTTAAALPFRLLRPWF